MGLPVITECSFQKGEHGSPPENLAPEKLSLRKIRTLNEPVVSLNQASYCLLLAWLNIRIDIAGILDGHGLLGGPKQIVKHLLHFEGVLTSAY